MSKSNNNNTPNKETSTTRTFANKLQICNTYLENLRIDCEIAKKIDAIEKLSKKDELTSEEIEKMDTLTYEKSVLVECKKLFSKDFKATSEDFTTDKFALVCAWVINPVHNKSKDTEGNVIYDITFNGQNKVVGAIIQYYKKYFNEKDSKEKTDSENELLTICNDFVNQYLPHEKSEVLLTPCDSTTATLTMCKFVKDSNTVLATKDIAIPKNVMEDGYKPMHIKFTRVMLKDLVSSCVGRLKWTNKGIVRGSVDDYAIIHQLLLTALSEKLDFATDVKKAYAKHII